jgi:hypothetical protein
VPPSRGRARADWRGHDRNGSVGSWSRRRDLKLEEFVVGRDKLVAVTVEPDPSKKARDIEVPSLTPILVRKRTRALGKPVTLESPR